MSRLPRVVTALLALVVPVGRQPDVIGDLTEDYEALRFRRGRPHAMVWLVGETLSLLTGFAWDVARRTLRTTPFLVRDLQLSCRALARRPLAAAGAASMLATGLVAVLLTLGLSSLLLFRPISAAHGDRVVRIVAFDRQGAALTRLSAREVDEIRRHLDGSADVATVNLQPVLVGVGTTRQQTLGETVSGNYFAMAGVRTRIGRTLLAADDDPASAPAVVISDTLWRDRFGRAPSALGSTITLNSTDFTVVGIAAAGGSSSFLGASVDVWVPTEHGDAVLNRGWRTNPADRWFTAIALPTAGTAELDARLTVATAALAEAWPDPWRDRRLATQPGTVLLGSQRTAARGLAAVLPMLSTLILAVAISNLAGVLLARAASNRRVAAIHLSIGAGRGALIRRQIIEGSLLGVAAAGVALAVYLQARTALGHVMLLPTLALRLELPLSLEMVLLVALGGLMAGGALAVGPAVWSTRLDVSRALASGGDRVGGERLSRVRRVLVSGQVACTLVLLAGAVLFFQSLDRLATADVGFSRDRLVAVDFDVEPATAAGADLTVVARQALARAAVLPGVTGAAMSNRAPIDQSTPTLPVRLPGDGVPDVRDVTFYLVTADYFNTIGLRLLHGRPFSPAECEGDEAVAIVNQTLAQQLWPDGSAIGRAIELADRSRVVRVIGIARDSKYRSLAEPPRPHVYLPTPATFGLTLLVRTEDNPRRTLSALQDALDATGPGVVGFFPRTLDDHVAIELLPIRVAATVASSLGAVALLLSAVGLYGLVSWLVALKRREIGVRLALGARPVDIRRMVVAEGVRAAAPGLVGGLLLAAGVAALLRRVLLDIGPFDLFALSLGAAALLASVVIASWIPAQRAAGTDPTASLRG